MLVPATSGRLQLQAVGLQRRRQKPARLHAVEIFHDELESSAQRTLRGRLWLVFVLEVWLLSLLLY